MIINEKGKVNLKMIILQLNWSCPEIFNTHSLILMLNSQYFYPLSFVFKADLKKISA